MGEELLKMKLPIILLSCKNCRLIKESVFFYKNKTNKTGYRSDCKLCHENCKKKWSKRNPQKIKEYLKKWRLKNHENEKIKSYNRKWKKSNPEKVLIYNKRADKKQIDLLLGSYVRKRIHSQFKISSSLISPEMIQLKREQLQLYRTIKEVKNGFIRTRNQGNASNEQRNSAG